MGFLDKIKEQASVLKDKAVDTAVKNSDKITAGLDKAGELADKKTKGKYTHHIETSKVKAKQGLEKLDTSTPPQTGTPAPPAPDAFGTATPPPGYEDPNATPPPIS